MAFSEVLRLVLDVDDRGSSKVKGFGDTTTTTMSRVGDQMSQVGGTLTRSVTLPLVALGGVATHMAGQFDSAFTEMQTLAGVSADEVAGLKDEVLALAGETGRAPQELADALMAIRSAGLDGQVALDALEASAKGAAAGLGSTRDVAEAVTNAINGYGAANLTASEATDVLIASVREGKAEASTMAPQFGRLVPIAAELGIEFGELGGAFAFLTKSSGDASLAATQLSGVMAKLLEPGVEGREVLDRLGMSLDDLRASIREKGLHQTLIDLRDALEANGLELNDFSADQQFLQGALALTGASVEDARAVIEATTNSVGATDEAFGKWADSMGAENARAFADFQVAMIHLGDALAPIAADIASFLGDMASRFSDLPGPVQNAIVAVAGLMAALGPILSVSGRLISTFSSVAKLLSEWAVPNSAVQGLGSVGTNANTAASAMSRLSAAMVSAAGTIGLLIAGGAVLDRMFPRTAANLNEMENALLRLGQTGDVTGPLEDIGEDFSELNDAIAEIADPSNVERVSHVFDDMLGPIGTDKLENIRDDIDDIDKALAQLAARSPEEAAAALDALIERMGLSSERADEFRGMLDNYQSTLAGVDTADATSEVDALGGAFDTSATEAEQAAQALQTYKDSVDAMFDPLVAAEQAMRNQQQAMAELHTKQLELIEAVRVHGEGSAEAMVAQDALTEAEGRAREAVIDLHQAATDLTFAVNEQGLSIDEAKQKFIEIAVQQGLTAEEAAALANQFFLTEQAAASYAGDYRATASMDDFATTVIDRVQQRLDQLDGRTVTANVIATIFEQVARATTPRTGAPVKFHEGGIVPGPRGQEVAAILQAGERVLPLDHQLVNVSPASFGGGGLVVYETHNHFHGPVAKDSERWVSEMVNRGIASNRINNRGRRL